MIHIGVILTCYNRVKQTIECLSAFKTIIEKYNSSVSENNAMDYHIYLTNDGCTDGTEEEARNLFSQSKLTIVKGNGSLFWAGGMRKAWNKAIDSRINYDYFLLLNDDTTPLPNLIDELMACDKYAMEKYHKHGVYSGICCSKKNPHLMTYGGHKITNSFKFTIQKLKPNGKVQECDMTNANILLVHRDVVNAIGIFYDGYVHGIADIDYSIIAKKKGFPVLLTPNFCGKCDDDHADKNEIKEKITNMSKAQRKEYFNSPLHSSKDYLKFIRRVAPQRYPLVWLFRFLNLNCPKLYYYLDSFR